MKKLPDDKNKIIEEFAIKEGDTGSPEVQIALLTQRIEKLSEHLTENTKDNHSRRGLLGIISKRRRLLVYLRTIDEKRYNALIKKLELKK
jgi:small subunit ribosomal protein S15